MLTIRATQLSILGRNSRREFEDRMVAHISTGYPRHYARLGEEGARRLVRDAIETGEARGIDTVGAVSVLIELMVEFGERFERAPDRGWAAEILENPALPGQLKVRLIRDRFEARTQGRTVVLSEPSP